MKTLSERNRILNEVKDSCYLAFFDGNPEEGGKEILTGRKKVNFPVATNGYVKSTNQLDFTGGEEDTVAYGETSQKTYTGKNMANINDVILSSECITSVEGNEITVKLKDTSSASVSAWTFVQLIKDKISGKACKINFEAVGLEGVSCTFYRNTTHGSPSITWLFGGATFLPGDTVTFPDLSSYADVGIVLYANRDTAGTSGHRTVTYKNVQLEIGQEVTEYEPFVGGVPAPNPDYPQDLETVTIGNIHLCKMIDYDETVFQDYVYTENGKWYKHAEVGYRNLSENVEDDGWSKSEMYFSGHNASYYNGVGNPNTPSQHKAFCSHAVNDDTNCSPFFRTGNANYFQFRNVSRWASLTDFKNWLSSNNVIVTYPLATATDTEITDATTIAALEEMFGNATGVAKYWGIYDSEVGGKLLYYFIMPYDVNIVKDSTVTINAGNCVLKEG